MSSESRFPAWAWGIAGAITVLALTILVYSIVMGVRAGQAQVEVQRRQQIGIALQQATDLQIGGQLKEALAQYQKVLVLDPNNVAAQQGIQNLLTLAASGTPVAVVVPAPAAAQPAPASTGPTQAPTVATTAPVSSTTAATPGGDPAIAAWERAQAAGKAGRWQQVLDELTTLRQSSPGFRPAEVTALLDSSYINLAADSDNADNLEEALALYDMALGLQPDPAIQRERDLISMYLDALTYSDADWQRAIQALEDLYAEDPQYRDVETRLQEAHTAYGDQLAGDEQWCLATEEYESALSVTVDATVTTKRDAAKAECAQNGNVASSGGLTGTTTTSTTATSTGAVAGTPTATTAPVADTETSSEGPTVGTLLYSAKDINSGRPQVWEMPVKLGTAQLLLQDAAQPAMRGDGTRLAFRNLRSNSAGISGFDPDTGLMLRFTTYAEDSSPSWNPQGSRIVFASNREGDRRWRIYTVWAENDGATETLGFGEAPSWSQSTDTIAYRGCDDSGNNCGIWTMSGSSNNHVALTKVADDTHPAWSPDGSFVVFMSSSRDGNNDIYRVDTATGEVTNLTSNAALDALPTVSPDGEWVAFVSNRDGAWKIYAVPASGGAAKLIAPIIGDLGNWSDQGLQWGW